MSSENIYKYTIGVVARRTQTHPETLRVWERRYKLIVPGRSETGRRLYSEDDITKLKLVKELTELGHPVSNLAKLSVAELMAILQANNHSHTTLSTPSNSIYRVFIANETLRTRIGKELIAYNDIEIVDDEHQADTANYLADFWIDSSATIHEGSAQEVQQKLAAARCKKAIVIYSFGNKLAVRQLEQSGVICLKNSCNAADIHRVCTDSGLQSSASHKQPSTTAKPPLFNAQQLAKVAAMTGTIACECPNHLAELIVNLGSFEKYSIECANRNEQDALVHEQLSQSTGRAREILEASLAKLLEIEGIVI